MNWPQKTPTIDAPLSSVRLSGIFGMLAGGEADDQEPPVPRGRAQRRFGVLATDRIVDDVGAGAVGQRLDALLQIFLGVVDDQVGAVTLAGLELLRPTRPRRSRARP